MASKLKVIKDLGYEAYNPKENKEEHKEESKMVVANDTADDELEEDPPVPLVTQVNIILRSIFAILRCTSTISKLSIRRH